MLYLFLTSSEAVDPDNAPGADTVRSDVCGHITLARVSFKAGAADILDIYRSSEAVGLVLGHFTVIYHTININRRVNCLQI